MCSFLFVTFTCIFVAHQNRKFPLDACVVCLILSCSVVRSVRFSLSLNPHQKLLCTWPLVEKFQIFSFSYKCFESALACSFVLCVKFFELVCWVRKCVLFFLGCSDGKLTLSRFYFCRTSLVELYTWRVRGCVLWLCSAWVVRRSVWFYSRYVMSEWDKNLQSCMNVSCDKCHRLNAARDIGEIPVALGRSEKEKRERYCIQVFTNMNKFAVLWIGEQRTFCRARHTSLGGEGALSSKRIKNRASRYQTPCTKSNWSVLTRTRFSRHMTILCEGLKWPGTSFVWGFQVQPEIARHSL